MQPTEDSNMPSGADTDNSDTGSELQEILPPLSQDDAREYEKLNDTGEEQTTKTQARGEDRQVGTGHPRTKGSDESAKETSFTNDTSWLFEPLVPRGSGVPNGTETNTESTKPAALEVSQRSISFSENLVVILDADQAEYGKATMTTKTMSCESADKATVGETSGVQHQKDPEGSRTSRCASRRFDEEMMKAVMVDEEEKKAQERDITPILEENDGLTREKGREVISEKEPDFSIEKSETKQSGEQSGELKKESTKPEILNEGVRTSREPPATPARHPSVQEFENPSSYRGEESMTLDTCIEHEQTTAIKQTQTFTLQAPEAVHHDLHVAAPGAASPTASPSPTYALLNNQPLARPSIASASTNDYHHSNTRMVYHHSEPGIPHLPPLVLPPSSSGASMSGYPTMSSVLARASNQILEGGKRRIYLRMEEDVSKPERSLFSTFRRRSILRNASLNSPINESEPSVGETKWVYRGSLTVSWYEGTSSLELQEHVRNSVVRKLRLPATTKLAEFRILDDSVNPPEEIVLCPYIPNGSTLLLRFTTKEADGEATPLYPRLSDYSVGPPESPSAAPSPYPRTVDLGGLGLNANQLALLGARLKGLQMPSPDDNDTSTRTKLVDSKKPLPRLPSFKVEGNASLERSSKDNAVEPSSKTDEEDDNSNEGSNLEVASLHPEDPVQKSLREITELLIAERRKAEHRYAEPRQEKRQVIFVLANYFVLFLSLIAISAEIQARAPDWHASMERYLKDVQNCSKDKESLFECVENGDMAGLIASVVLWISRSAATKRIFLFGFESPKKLWTVVYESLVTAVCWGFSYMFIRRGMNPDTSRNFIQKYWKDAVYGSLAGFNAAFMKHVLKNLIPQEAIEDALQERQLKILSWLPSFHN